MKSSHISVDISIKTHLGPTRAGFQLFTASFQWYGVSDQMNFKLTMTFDFELLLFNAILGGPISFSKN